MITPLNEISQKYKLPVSSSDPAGKNTSYITPENKNEYSDSNNLVPATGTERENLPGHRASRENAMAHTDLKENSMYVSGEKDSVDFFDAAPFGMALILIDGAISRVNYAFLQLLGYTSAEFTGKNLTDIFYTDDTAQPDTFYTESVIADKGVTVEKKIMDKNGNILHVLLKSSVIRYADNKPDLLLVQLVDITEKKEFEELIQRRNHELEKANKELDHFVYSTSHDLRAPLRSILGLIYIMQSENNPDTMKTYLDMMRISVNRMDAFIKEIVELSRNSQQGVKIEKVDLPAIVSEIFENLRYIPGAEKIDFTMESGQNTEFFSDISRIKVVLNNLIANAITYHNFNQDNPMIKVHAVIKNRYALIEVIDNGRGIKKEHQDKIFDMFYRASEDTKGSGLGLYIVKEAIAKLNGNIQLKSKWGAGTTFTIKIMNSKPLS
jgi:PAS domain S-box-containing protein